jgi:hypothetical protein
VHEQSKAADFSSLHDTLFKSIHGCKAAGWSGEDFLQIAANEWEINVFCGKADFMSPQKNFSVERNFSENFYLKSFAFLSSSSLLLFKDFMFSKQRMRSIRENFVVKLF